MNDYSVKFGKGDISQDDIMRLADASRSWWRRWFVWRHVPRLLLEISALRTQRDFAAGLLHEYGRVARERAGQQ